MDRWNLQSWPKLCGTHLQNGMLRPSIVSHGNKRSLGKIIPFPLPPCIVGKERLPKQSSNIASGREGVGGGGGGGRTLQELGIKAKCPTHIGQDCSLCCNNQFSTILAYTVSNPFRRIGKNFTNFAIVIFRNVERSKLTVPLKLHTVALLYLETMKTIEL